MCRVGGGMRARRGLVRDEESDLGEGPAGIGEGPAGIGEGSRCTKKTILRPALTIWHLLEAALRPYVLRRLARARAPRAASP